MTSDVFSELPPRARRIPGAVDAGAAERGTTSACAENTGSRGGLTFYLGTTSACAENTVIPAEHFFGAGNYLRVRGEYSLPAPMCPARKELPPRARRIPAEDHDPLDFDGTTSACAENTPPTRGGCVHHGNYLRVRGEYAAHPRWVRPPRELPPRARRIPVTFYCVCYLSGTTSACAENTW